tara:strand:+ start:392 stop:949 length:558 start_codon:yes stop_codon:yes gene_type:complete
MVCRAWLGGDGRSPSSTSNVFLTLCRLYIIEGIITVVWAAICIYVVPKNYETAYFLNEDDKVIMRRRAELSEAYSGGSGHYGMKDIKEAAKDIKSWLHGVIQICVVTILYGKSTLMLEGGITDDSPGFGTFLPLIIKNGFHYSTVQAQYLVIPGTISPLFPIRAPLTNTSQSLGCNRLRNRRLPL